MGRVVILTGESGAGKSVTCARVAERAHGEGHTVAGLLTLRNADAASETASAASASVAQANASSATAVDDRRVIDLKTGESFAFGRRDRQSMIGSWGAPMRTLRGDMAADALPGWELDPAVFVRGDAVLRAATPCDLLIVDELGPLELLYQRGWTEAIPVLCRREYALTLVVCRPSLVDLLFARLGHTSPWVVEATEVSRDRLPRQLLQLLHPAAGAAKTHA